MITNDPFEKDLNQKLSDYIGSTITPELLKKIAKEITELAERRVSQNPVVLCGPGDSDDTLSVTVIYPQDGELFYCTNGNGAFVPREKGRHIDWDTAMDAWRKLAGDTKEHHAFLSIGLDHNEWLHGVPYTWTLAGAGGAKFCVYQFPDVPDSAVTECCLELKRNRDVVGRINKVRIKNLLDFDCPKHTPIS